MPDFRARNAIATAMLCAVNVGSAAAAAVPRDSIARTIRADVAEVIAGINAHDPDRATAFDAPDIVSMESGRPPSLGAAADKQGIAQAFKYSPTWHLTMVDEAVDVSESGDMAVYRSTYNQDSTNDGVPMTQRVNFLAGFRRQANGPWKIGWSVVCATERPHKR